MNPYRIPNWTDRTKHSPRKNENSLSKGVRVPFCVREFIDYDYQDDLSPAEAAWLSDFTKKYYLGGAFPNKDDPDWNQEERKKSYNSRNANNRDLWPKAVDTNGLLNGDDSDDYEEED